MPPSAARTTTPPHPPSLALAATVCLAWLMFSASQAYAQATLARVEFVNDGDTVTLQYQGRRELVRLLGVDAPETVHSPRLHKAAQAKGRPADREAELGAQVRDWLTRLMPVGSTVLLETDPFAPQRDQYGRLLAYINLSTGPQINETLLAQGLARAYHNCHCRKQERFLQIEHQARAAKRGLWARAGGP